MPLVVWGDKKKTNNLKYSLSLEKPCISNCSLQGSRTLDLGVCQSCDEGGP